MNNHDPPPNHATTSDHGAHLLLLLTQEIAHCLSNSYTAINYDADRHGTLSIRSRIADVVLNVLRRLGFVRFDTDALGQFLDELTPHVEGLQELYEKLADPQSQRLLVTLLAYRALGYRKVKLRASNDDYWRRLTAVTSKRDPSRTIRIEYKNWELSEFKFEEAGIPVTLYTNSQGALTLFELRQYEFRRNNVEIAAKPGDIVIDCGGCWGDTALYFAARVHPTGRVYAFEFIPSNLEIFQRNLDLNPQLSSCVEIVQHAVWSDSNASLHFKDQGPGSRVAFEARPGYEGTVRTLTIDDLVERESLSGVNFIKMDIEGAETWALRGAEKTIKRFHPALAISVYHQLGDFVQVPRIVSSFLSEYEYHLEHFTIHAEETVLFAV